MSASWAGHMTMQLTLDRPGIEHRDQDVHERGQSFTEVSELKNIDRSVPGLSVWLSSSDLLIRRRPPTDAAWKEPFGAD